MLSAGRLLAVIAVLLLNIPCLQAAPKCLHVMSYNKGYEWNDGVEAGVEKNLAGKCELRKFYMDSKRNTSQAYMREMALKAKAEIESFKPDVVIVSDDNASRYLVQPYYKDAGIPFVFNGINWTAEEYGYPYSNATGMVEVVPIRSMLKIARRNINTIRKVAFLSADVLTEYKDFEHYRRVYTREGIDVKGVFVKTMREWEQAFTRIQDADMIILGNNAGINDWDKQRARQYVFNKGKTLTFTTYTWMMPYSTIGVSKDASEQGEWAAQVALHVLDGMKISDIPIVVNRRWNLYTNRALLKQYNLVVDRVTQNKAINKNWNNAR